MDTMGSLGEFGFIDRLKPFLSDSPEVLTGLGDDCAVIRSGKETLLVTCDASLEGVHFQTDNVPPYDLGWKAAAGAVSDIAAMGGVPKFLLVTLGAPSGQSIESLEGIYEGIKAIADASGVVIIGGDTIQSPERLLLDITVIGNAPENHYKLRKGAQNGDMLIVTGTPGRSAAGRLAHEQGLDFPTLHQAHFRPQPRIAEGQWLCQRDDVHAMIDVSDGVLRDAGHIAEASGLGVAFTSASVAVDPDLMDYCITSGNAMHDLVFAGGEDYELAFAVAPETSGELLKDFRTQFDIPAYILGEFSNSYSGVLLDGHAPESTGYEHFKQS